MINVWINFESGDFHQGKNNYRGVLDHTERYYVQHVPYYQADYECYCGLVDLEMGQIDSAKIRLANIDRIIPSVLPLFQYLARYRHNLLLAKILFAEKRFTELINLCKRPKVKGTAPWIGSWIHTNENMPAMQDELARAYYDIGQLDKAIETYEKITKIHRQEQVRDLIHPLYHYRLAKLYEENSEPEKAIERYERFLELWKEADEELPEPKDARMRLENLKQGS
jgi:tetratricopeptide (TPR) repeat protein